MVDITPFVDRKQQAIACYSSQVTALNEGTTTLLSSSLNLPSLQAEARCCGAQIGVEFGESFVTKAAVPIEDPILHFNKSTIELATLFPETL